MHEIRQIKFTMTFYRHYKTDLHSRKLFKIYIGNLCKIIIFNCKFNYVLDVSKDTKITVPIYQCLNTLFFATK